MARHRGGGGGSQGMGGLEDQVKSVTDLLGKLAVSVKKSGDSFVGLAGQIGGSVAGSVAQVGLSPIQSQINETKQSLSSIGSTVIGNDVQQLAGSLFGRGAYDFVGSARGAMRGISAQAEAGQDLAGLGRQFADAGIPFDKDYAKSIYPLIRDRSQRRAEAEKTANDVSGEDTNQKVVAATEEGIDTLIKAYQDGSKAIQDAAHELSEYVQKSLGYENGRSSTK